MAKEGCIKNYMDEAALKNLKEHKYAASGQSFLEPYMQYFWRPMLELVPLWMAPNLITALGLSVNVVSTLVLLYFNPYFDGTYTTPWWAYAGCGVGLFIYQTLDALDGKQARRTNSATPLGELFDHGCDAISTIFVVLAAGASLQAGPWSTLVCLLLGQATFYCAHWRTYVCAKMHFGRVDVTEAQWCMITIHMLSAVYGGGVWHTEVGGHPLYFWILLAMWTVSFFTVLNNINCCLEGGVGPEQTTVAETSVASPAIPLLLSLAGTLFVSSFPCFVSAPWLVMVTMGFALAKLSIKIVLCHMAKMPLEMTDIAITMPLLFFFDSFFGLNIESLLLLSVMCLVITWNLGFYCAGVVKEITSYLRISCFTIKPPEKMEKKE